MERTPNAKEEERKSCICFLTVRIYQDEREWIL